MATPSMIRAVVLSVLLAIAAAPAAVAQTSGEAVSRVYLNGVPTPVHFNDGDSFRVLAGEHKGTRARLAGFNTLETFGPVHRWGTWHEKELYVISKLGTLNARQGVWRCETKTFEKDTYGRILWHCRDLAIDQIRRGLAHALSVSYEPSDPELIAAQQDAIQNRRGMWAHGVPEYVLTSLHSASEGGGRDGRTYNRLVSSRDGHSAKWQHDNSYGECEWVCRQEMKVSQKLVKNAVEEIIVDPEIGGEALKLGDKKLTQIVGDYARLGYFGGVDDDEVAAGLEKKLLSLKEAGELGDRNATTGSCSLYVVFERRYGPTRPGCLK